MSSVAEPRLIPLSASETAPPTVSPSRVTNAVVVGAWAALFWFIWLSGRTPLFLGVRTQWVVPIGALVLTGALAGRLGSIRVDRPQPLTTAETLRTVVMVLPVVILLALPAASLGSYAVGRRSTLTSGGSFADALIPATGDLSMVDVAGALRSRETMRALVRRAGSASSFTGFISLGPGEAADEFLLNRFVVSCCVADALDTQIRVVNAPPGEFGNDDWVRVTGKLYPLGKEVIVDASAVVPVAKPHRPYLSP
jgi:uncharacterized repeat protein (TIGR03943 family)